MSDAIIVRKLEMTVIIQFNRPARRNPLSVSIVESLSRIFDDLSIDQTIKKLIITGRDDIFAAGANLREIALLTKKTAPEFALRGQTLMNKVANMNQLTIAAVNGFCFGGALDLALACRYRIASENAQFAHPGANLGIITGWGGTQRLPRLIGEAAALEMFLTAKRVSAREAKRIGLIDEIAENPLQRALEEFPAGLQTK